LVKPLGAGYTLPTDAFKEPTRGEFLFEGRMEGKPEEAKPAPSTPEPALGEGHQLM
jgi:pilus assembly protein CpaC